ncbi:ran-binding protein 3-like [Bombina bombina]|uniref:ran-binding protein 3-like n=1 Tax=Bombina bombina TaxID=8345 RepID=UPI00235A481B|nr:ran-binding protein 3-like [Bombina bombina]
MRNQQAPAIRVNTFYPEIEPLCRDSAATCRLYGDIAAGHPKKVPMCLTAKEQGAAVAAHGQLLAERLSNNEREKYQHSAKEKAPIVQPVFVIENKERPIKRHAVDLVLRAENGLSAYPEKRARSSSFTCRTSHSSSHTDYRTTEKRVRSSSFTLLPAFPAMKNNIFMPSTLLKEHFESSITESGKVHEWNIIKPATLQPPKITLCQEEKLTWAGTASLRCQPEDKPVLSEEQNDTTVNDVDKPRPAIRPSCILETKTRNHQSEPKFTSNKNVPDFVFGENMDKRVMGSPQSGFQTSLNLVKPNVNGKTSSLSSWSYQKHNTSGNKTLIESAAAYTSKPSIKYELDKVEIITGEESERNVLQINCKLFALKRETQVWIEKGRGYLRLNDTDRNDSGMFKSRIVMRNHGNLKLVLNSKIWDGMKLEKVSRKNLCITATDLEDQNVKVFLIQASVKDAGRLYAAIHHRLVALRSCKKKEPEAATQSETKADSDMHPLNYDSDDEDEMTSFYSKHSDHIERIRRRPILYS